MNKPEIIIEKLFDLPYAYNRQLKVGDIVKLKHFNYLFYCRKLFKIEKIVYYNRLANTPPQAGLYIDDKMLFFHFDDLQLIYR